jgi:hypothetical protein
MTHKGIPDGSRSARLILKDYVNGKLLFCYPPPGYDAAEFQHYDARYGLNIEEDEDDQSDDEGVSNEGTPKVKFIVVLEMGSSCISVSFLQ